MFPAKSPIVSTALIILHLVCNVNSDLVSLLMVSVPPVKITVGIVLGSINAWIVPLLCD